MAELRFIKKIDEISYYTLVVRITGDMKILS